MIFHDIIWRLWTHRIRNSDIHRDIALHHIKIPYVSVSTIIFGEHRRVFVAVFGTFRLAFFTSGDATGSYGATGAPQASPASGDPRAVSRRDGLEDFPRAAGGFESSEDF